MENKVIKNMEYWKKKNNIPGIEGLEDSGLADGRAGSSPFQIVQPNPVVAPVDPIKKPTPPEPLSNGAMSGGVGEANDAIQTKVDAKIDEKVEQAMSGGDGSALAMKSPIYAGVETKEARGEMMGDEGLLPGENDAITPATKDDSAGEIQADLEDRIEFLSSDIEQGNYTDEEKETMKKTLAILESKGEGKDAPTKIYEDGKRRKNYKY